MNECMGLKRNFNKDELLIIHWLLVSVLTKSDDRIFLVDGPGETVKMYLYVCLSQILSGNFKKVIIVA